MIVVFRFCMACTDLNFVCRFCVTVKIELMHQSFKTPGPRIGDDRGIAGPFSS